MTVEGLTGNGIIRLDTVVEHSNVRMGVVDQDYGGAESIAVR